MKTAVDDDPDMTLEWPRPRTERPNRSTESSQFVSLFVLWFRSAPGCPRRHRLFGGRRLLLEWWDLQSTSAYLTSVRGWKWEHEAWPRCQKPVCQCRVGTSFQPAARVPVQTRDEEGEKLSEHLLELASVCHPWSVVLPFIYTFTNKALHKWMTKTFICWWSIPNASLLKVLTLITSLVFNCGGKDPSYCMNVETYFTKQCFIFTNFACSQVLTWWRVIPTRRCRGNTTMFAWPP